MATKQHILFLLLFFFSGGLIAQHNKTIIKGCVVDALTHENISNTTIILIQLPDSIIMHKAVSNNHGFSFNINPGNYRMHLSHVGYRDSTILLSLNEKDSIFHTGILFLHKLSTDLAPVVVTAKIPPIIYKNDTMFYNTAAFATRPNAMVEELLKKLPGIQVDKEGNITLHGEKIQKIFIDGKEFFINDPKQASKNLPADLIDKIEVFNDKSERAKYTGIPDNPAVKAINLKLKPEKKKGIFGNLFGGYGSGGRYSLKTSINHFKGGQFVSASLNGNKGGSLESSTDMVSLANRGLSINYRNQLNKRLDLGIGYSQSGSNSVTTGNNNRHTFFADSTLVQKSDALNSNKSNSKGLSTNLDYQIDSFNKVQIGVSLSASQANTQHNISTNSQWEKEMIATPINKADNILHQLSKRWSESIGLNFHHRFRKTGRYWGINFNHGYSQDKNEGNLGSITRFYNNNGLIIDSLVRDQESGQLSHSQQFSINTTYTEPISKNMIIDLSYNLNYSFNNSGQQTFNYNPTTHQYDTADSLTTNDFTGLSLTQQISMGYNYIKKKWRGRLGVSVQNQKLKNGNTATGLKNIQQRTHTIITTATGILHINRQNELEISTSGNTRQPTVEQLQPVPDYSNPLIIKLGNPGLKPEFSYTANILYRVFNDRGSSFASGCNFSNTFNNIVNAVYTNNQGIQQQQYVNVGGNYSLSAQLSYGVPFSLFKDWGKGNVSLSSNLSYSEHTNLVNETKNTARSISCNQQASVHYHFKDRLFIDLSMACNWNHTAYALQPVQTASYIAAIYNSDIFYEAPAGLTVSTNINCQINNSRQSLPAQNRLVWNATVSKRVFNRAGEIKLSAFDLLNTNNNFNRTIGDNYIETTNTQVIRQVLVLSFLYHFRFN